MKLHTVLLTAVGIVVIAWLLQQFRAKEGFQTRDMEPEDRMTPEAFSYNILQVVKGPIRRLSSQLLDLRNWKERLELAKLSPVELARRNLRS